MEKHGARGKQIFCFEWKNHKRLLRSGRIRRFTTVRKKDKHYYRRLYNIDDHGSEFCKILDTSAPSARRPGGGDWDKMYREYIKHVVKQDEYYSKPVMKSELRDDGEVLNVEEETFFQVHDTVDGSSRLKQVATSFVDADTRIRDESALAILVQYMDVWSRDGDVVQVYFDADPQWVNALETYPTHPALQVQTDHSPNARCYLERYTI